MEVRGACDMRKKKEEKMATEAEGDEISSGIINLPVK
jgi:hypothetical protein